MREWLTSGSKHRTWTKITTHNLMPSLRLLNQLHTNLALILAWVTFQPEFFIFLLFSSIFEYFFVFHAKTNFKDFKAYENLLRTLSELVGLLNNHFISYHVNLKFLVKWHNTEFAKINRNWSQIKLKLHKWNWLQTL